MKCLYAPWRSDYASKVDQSKTDDTSADSCIFCLDFSQSSTQHLILKQATHAYVMMNRYPYNAGHLLIVPFAHQGALDELDQSTRAELMELVAHSTDILAKVLGAHGVNIGINLGKAAGAGIPAHLHIHVLPRWIGDTNFLPTLADTKQISFDLHQIYHQLLPAFDQIAL